MENQSAQQSESQNNQDPAATTPQENVQQPAAQAQQPASQPAQPVQTSEVKQEAPVEKPKQAETTPAQQQNSAPGNEVKSETKEEGKVEGAVEPSSQQVSNPVDTTKDGHSPVNSTSNAPVNSQNNTESNPQSISQSNPQVNSQSNPQSNPPTNPPVNTGPVSYQAPPVDKVDNGVRNDTSNDRLAASSISQHQSNSSAPTHHDAYDSGYNSQPQATSDYPLKLFVGGLYYQTEEDVLNYFKQYGKVVDCQLLRHRQTGRSRGFAFVTMDDPTGTLIDTILARRNEINGKYVDIKKAEDNKTREKVEKSSCKIFVGGIEGSVTTEEMKDFFQGYGDVKEAVVLRNITTNASRGFGFVTFEDPRIADDLIRDNNCVLKGKRMDVKGAEPKDSTSTRQPPRRDYGQPSMPPRGRGGMGRDHGGYGAPPVDPYQRPSYRGGYSSRDKYTPEYDYIPPQYDAYPPQGRGPSRYPDYGMPPQHMDPTPVATIAPYAPPAAASSYGGYNPQPAYSYGQPAAMPQEPKPSSYGGGSQYMGGNSGSSSGGYGRDKPRDHMYSKPYGQMQQPPPQHQHQQQPSYGQYGKQSSNDQYMGGPSRDYNSQNKNHRYKPY